MDSELSALPPEDVLHKRAPRARQQSLRYSAEIPPTNAASHAMSRWNGYDAEPPSSMPTIHAPTPRRHLIDTSESQHWLGSPPLSPVSSTRAVSPFATHFPSNTSPTSATSTSIRGKKAPDSPTRRRTFSSLYNTDNPPKHLRQRQTSNASISSTYTVHGAANTVSLHKALLRSKYTQAHGETEHASLGRRWIRSMHKRGLRTWVIPGAIAFATLVKLCLGVGSYSGEATPPMYGDYEAQRHWMEITTHLPFREWYTYDLQYWGLDYPPLTAYVSWLCGLVGSWANPTWFALDASRGIETPGSKLYMRLTVVFFDMLVYIPALIMFVKTWQGTRSKRTQEQALLLLLLQPALLLIDHGHFQYNSVMLGFTLLSINFFATGNDLVAAVFFVLSLGFKQMALYYAPAIGSYLLAKCIYLGPKKGFTLFTRLAVTTVASFAILFLPFFLPGLAPSPLHILHPIQRIFPFSRGLFEDKVANFWCASNVVIKWRKLAGDGDTGRSWLVRTSALLTALGFLPGVLGLLRAGWIMRIREDGSTQKARELDTTITNIAEEGAEKDVDDSKNDNPPPFLPLLSYALLTSSMSFFLFSFQVHEKTILLPLLPLTLLMSGAQPGTALHSWGALGNNVAVFSMWPLLKRDGLAVPYIATVVLWNRLVGYNPLTNLSVDFRQLFSLAVYSAAIALHALELVIAPPARYPDLFPVLNVLISTPVFVLIWLWSIKCGVEVAWALGGLSSSSSSGVTAGQSLGTTTGGPGRTGSLVPEDRDVAELEVPLEGPASVLLSVKKVPTLPHPPPSFLSSPRLNCVVLGPVMSSAPVYDLSQPLATLLREGTKQAHTDAETSQGARLLLGGQLPKDEYVRFLMMLWYVYDTIERGLDRHSTYPTLEPTYNPTLLARASTLSADIAYLLEVPEDQWKAHPIHKELVTPRLPQALETYLSRLQALADSPDPSPLLAHSYVRYLGDLSGGQSIKRIIAKAYGLESEDNKAGSDLGVSFYVFKQLTSANSASIGEMKKIKDWFRDGMNVAGERCEDEAKLTIVEEASNAFRLNMGIFNTIRTPEETKPTTKERSQVSKRRGESGTEQEPPREASWPLSSVAAVIAAVCLGHFVLVVGGFTGDNGYQKLLYVERWLSETFLKTATDAN